MGKFRSCNWFNNSGEEVICKSIEFTEVFKVGCTISSTGPAGPACSHEAMKVYYNTFGFCCF